MDEISRHCLEDDEPETVHIEVHLPGRLDHERLRTAFHQALARHPRVLMRQVPTRWWHRHYTWQLTPAPDVDPVVFPPPGPDALAHARARALTDCPPLDASPPVRLEVIEPAHAAPADGRPPVAPSTGTVLLLTLHHTALDGPACLRILATAAELYAGSTGPAGSTEPAGCTSPSGSADPTEPPAHPPRLPHSPHPPHPPHPPQPPGHSRPGLLTRPARLAPDHSTPTTNPTTSNPMTSTSTSGNGMLLTELPVPTRPPRPTGERPPYTVYTVNDQLLVATYLMAARWNQLHDRPAAPVVITMPIDDRPRGPHMPIGNGTRLAAVPFPPTTPPLAPHTGPGGAPHTTSAPTPLTRLLHRTSARTRALKSTTPRSPLGLPAAVLTSLPLPVGPRRALTRALRSLAAAWTPTTLLSNIGRVPYPLDFGETGGRATAVWFSAPARMPRGLSITTAATCDGDRIHLALRWSRALLDEAAASRLLDLFRSSLAATAWPPAATAWPPGSAPAPGPVPSAEEGGAP
ncbi:condensation protein [Streptomyces noursei]